MSRPRLFLILTLAVSTAGCGADDGLGRLPISGTITLDGKPLQHGLIQFQPTSDRQPVAAGGFVADGKYAIARESGPVPGTYRVTITAAGEPSKPAEDDIPGGLPPAGKELVPAAYNSNSQVDAVVKADGDNVFNLDMKSK